MLYDGFGRQRPIKPNDASFFTAKRSNNVIEFVEIKENKAILSTGASAGTIKDDSSRNVLVFKIHGHGEMFFNLGDKRDTLYSMNCSFYFYKSEELIQSNLTPSYNTSGWYQSFAQIGSNSMGGSKITIPSDAVYCALVIGSLDDWGSYIKNGIPQVMISEKWMTYEPFYIYELRIDSKLKNKSIYWIGDSIIAGLYCNSPISKKMDDIYGTLSTNKAVSNTTIYEGQIASQLNNFVDIQPDIVIFDGGANDTNQARYGTGKSAWGTSPGSVLNEAPSLTKSYGTTTVCGAFENTIKEIRTKYPKAKIVFVATHYIGSNHPYADQKACFEAFYEACKKWGVAIVDIHNHGNINSYLDDSFTSNGNAPDKTHPSDQAHYDYYIPMIISKLNEII